MADPKPTFSATQAAEANTALRAVLNLPPEQFPVPQFVAMISDEVQQLREAGHDDAAIAQIVRDSTGGQLTAEDIGQHYAPPEHPLSACRSTLPPPHVALPRPVAAQGGISIATAHDVLGRAANRVIAPSGRKVVLWRPIGGASLCHIAIKRTSVSTEIPTFVIIG